MPPIIRRKLPLLWPLAIAAIASTLLVAIVLVYCTIFPAIHAAKDHTAPPSKEAIMSDLYIAGGDLALANKQYAQAMTHYRAAVDAGNIDAMVKIAHLYENGLGVTPSFSQAASWYYKAAAAGNHEAKLWVSKHK